MVEVVLVVAIVAVVTLTVAVAIVVAGVNIAVVITWTQFALKNIAGVVSLETLCTGRHHRTIQNSSKYTGTSACNQVVTSSE